MVDLERYLTILILRTLGSSQDEVADVVHCAKQTVVEAERCFQQKIPDFRPGGTRFRIYFRGSGSFLHPMRKASCFVKILHGDKNFTLWLSTLCYH